MKLLPKVWASRRRGASAVEFALIAPLLFTVVFGIIEFGWIFMARQMVHHAAADSVRMAILPGYTETDIKLSVEEQLFNSLNLTAGKITVVPTHATDGNNPCESVTVNVLVDDVALPGYILKALGLRDTGENADIISFTVTMAHPNYVGQVLGVTCAGPPPPP